MSPTIRPLTPEDSAAVLALNERVVHLLAPMDPDRYRWFLEAAACAWAAEVEGELAGFVLVLAPGLDYPSDNYRWFSARYQRFLYLDRVAVEDGHRRRGVATAFYDAIEGLARRNGWPLLLEVNVVPPNEASLAFHAARGYEHLEDLVHPGGKVVRLLALTPADQR